MSDEELALTLKFIAMKTKIHSIHFDADKKLLDLIHEKIQKLTHFHDRIISCEVILKLDKSDAAENKVAEIIMQVPGSDLFAKKQSKTFEEAMEKVVEAIKQQILRNKEKVKS